jgi:hypothetical protein
LTLRNLEELGDVEEKLGLLVLGKDLPLVEQEDDFVENANTLLFLQGLVVKDVTLLNKGRLR